MYATFWSLVPPVVAIVLALITKEVYSSLFVGIATAALFYAQFHIVDAYTTMFRDGFITSLSDSSHVGILIFFSGSGNHRGADEQSRRFGGLWKMGAEADQDKKRNVVCYLCAGRPDLRG